jgi:hypothetical protein
MTDEIHNLATIEGCVPWTLPDKTKRAPVMAELTDLRAKAATAEQLRAFLNDEVLPRYMEMFAAAGLGEWSDSVVYQRAVELLG